MPWVIVLVALFLASYFAFLFFHARSAWRLFRGYPNAPSFNFSILDIFAATVGLFPTVWLAAEAMKGESFKLIGPLWLEVLVLGISQLYGIFVGRTWALVPPQNPPNVLADAVWVLGGAFFGLSMLLLSMLLFFILALGVLIVIFNPYALLLLVLVALAVLSWRHSQ